jgi:hypothetical protein
VKAAPIVPSTSTGVGGVVIRVQRIYKGTGVGGHPLASDINLDGGGKRTPTSDIKFRSSRLEIVFTRWE